jgi:nucleotide-binding universal stress UspA family protein
MRNSKVLIGYDGSRYADAAIDDLQRAGLPEEVKALVVTVGEAPTIPPLASHDLIEKALVGERVFSIVEHANKHVSETLGHARDLVLNASVWLKSYFPRWQIDCEVLSGTPAPELLRRAREWEADLVVVGSQGRSAIGRFLLGSVSLEVATDAACSVRIGRRGSTQSDRYAPRIVVGLDGSRAAERALHTVLRRAWPRGSELRIVAVDDGCRGVPPSAPPVLINNDREAGERRPRRDAPTAITNSNGLNISAVIREGDPYKVLHSEAREWDADCIVVGASSRHSTRGFLTWNVSTELAANAECSIEIVR